MARSVLRFRNLTVAKQTGEIARFKVLGGPDHGIVFVVLVPRITIGRGDENAIVLTDLKVSRLHAELVLENNFFTIKDIGSAHGFVVNGVPFKTCLLKSGDKIGLGETVLEFIVSTQANATAFIQRPSVTAPVVGGGANSGLTQFIHRPNFQNPSSTNLSNHQNSNDNGSFVEKNKKLILILGILALAAFGLPEYEKKQRKKKLDYVDPNNGSSDRSISSLNSPTLDEKSRLAAENYFKEGMREFRALNYIRARVAFETALQVNPTHVLSIVYLENTKKKMEAEAKTLIETAKKDEEANRLSGAIHKYEAVKRIYARDTNNALYKEAALKIEDLQKKIKDSEKI